jgi:hypothetical protein
MWGGQEKKGRKQSWYWLKPNYPPQNVINVHAIGLLDHVCPMNVFSFCDAKEEEVPKPGFDENCSKTSRIRANLSNINK